jgi:plasmid stability protein
MASITVKNIPDDLYADLKQAAAMDHRSINSEIIVCLERALHSQKIPVETLLPRAPRVWELADKHPVTDSEVTEAKRAGRP